jgi:hypothetical protein
MIRNCLICDVPFDVNLKHGRKQRYCGPTCRKRAQRLRVQSFVVDVKQETDEPAPLESFDQLGALVYGEAEMRHYRAGVESLASAYAVDDEQLIVEAETSGRSAWRYLTPDEVDVKEAKKAFDEFDGGNLWCAWFD